MKNKAEKRVLFGTIATMLSALIYGFNPLLAVNAYNRGSNEIAFIVYSAVVCLVVSIVILKVMKQPIKPDKGSIPGLLLTGFFGTVTTILLFTAYNYVDSGIATTMHFTYPTFVAIGSIFVLKEKLTKYKIAALLVSLVGIFFAADFIHSGSANLLGILIALISGMTYAGFILSMDKTGAKNLHFMRMCLYMTVIRLVMTFVYGAVVGKLAVSFDPTMWIITVVFALLVSIGATVLFQLGVRNAGASNAAIFSMFEPVTSIIVGFALMGEQFALIKMLGCVLILFGIVLTIMDGAKASEKEK